MPCWYQLFPSINSALRRRDLLNFTIVKAFPYLSRYDYAINKGVNTTMKNSITLVFAIFALAFAQFGFAQGQTPELIEPKLEIVDLAGMEARNVREGLEMRSAGLSLVRFGRLNIQKGYSTPSHNHGFEQMVLVLEGSIRVHSGDEHHDLGPGEMFMAPPFVHHYYEALEDSLTIEAFGPGAPPARN